MTVVLNKNCKNDLFIDLLNQELTSSYGANTSPVFLSWQALEEDAAYLNTHPDGLRQLPDWPRPISPSALQQSFFWYRTGEFHFKLSGGPTSDQARDALAVCKWIAATKGKYIDKAKSADYSPSRVKDYLDEIFLEAGYNLKELWKGT